MKRRLVFICFLASFACSNALACICGGPDRAKSMREVAEWYASRPEVALVFEGKVVKQEVRTGPVGPPSSAISITFVDKHRIVEFDVTRVFRGTQQTHLTIVTGMGTGDCGYDFSAGESYLVYASSLPGGTWFTSICSGTQTVEDSGTAIRFLSGEKPTADDLLSPQAYQTQYYKNVVPTRTGSVCGEVRKPDGTPLKGAIVQLWEPRDGGLPPHEDADPNNSSESGHFCIRDVAPGKYFLTAESYDYDHWARYMAFYPGADSQTAAAQLSIEKRVRHPHVTFTTFHESLYSIRITVVASDGTPLSYKNGCSVAVDSVDNDPLSYHTKGGLNEGGTTHFGYIPPGKYLVTTYFQSDFEGAVPKQFPEALRWKPARQEVVVRGDTTVELHLEPTNPN
jgi:protocatechuate 3,4-dioxygenase beta subunit